MDDERLDESSAAHPRPSETLRLRESYAKEVVENGLISLQHLRMLVGRLRSSLKEFASNLKAISLEEQQRSGALMHGSAPGAAELWNVLQSFTAMMASSNESTANELTVEFAAPLEEMHVSLDDLKKSVDLLKRKRKFDPVAMESHVEKDKKMCLKALKSLQSSVKYLVQSSSSSGILSKMTRRRYERAVKKKVQQVQELFQKYQDLINSYNSQFQQYETAVQIPLLAAIETKESQRLQLLKRCTLNLETYLSAITDPEQANSLLMKNALDTINDARHMSTVSSQPPRHKLQFLYDLPCTPDAFERHTWPGSSGLVWYTGSFREASIRKDSVGRRDTMPDIRASSSSKLWTVSQSGDSDHEVNDDLKTIEESDVEPKPESGPFSFVSPKIVGNWSEGVTRPGRFAGLAKGPGFVRGPDPISKLSGVFENLSRPVPGGGGSGRQKPLDNALPQKFGESFNDLSHLTMSRPALQRPRHRGSTPKT